MKSDKDKLIEKIRHITLQKIAEVIGEYHKSLKYTTRRRYVQLGKVLYYDSGDNMIYFDFFNPIPVRWFIGDDHSVGGLSIHVEPHYNYQYTKSCLYHYHTSIDEKIDYYFDNIRVTTSTGEYTQTYLVNFPEFNDIVKEFCNTANIPYNYVVDENNQILGYDIITDK